VSGQRLSGPQFIAAVVEDLRLGLPAEWRTFEARPRGAQVQVHFGTPRLHYEVWVDGRFSHVEIGLHFEADADTNLWLLQYFDRRLVEIRGESGQPAEAEHWTQAWARVHQVVEFERLDAELAEEVAGRLAQMIVVLQPMLDEALVHRA
jgi:hypothetical protein